MGATSRTFGSLRFVSRLKRRRVPNGFSAMISYSIFTVLPSMIVSCNPNSGRPNRLVRRSATSAPAPSVRPNGVYDSGLRGLWKIVRAASACKRRGVINACCNSYKW